MWVTNLSSIMTKSSPYGSNSVVMVSVLLAEKSETVVTLLPIYLRPPNAKTNYIVNAQSVIIILIMWVCDRNSSVIQCICGNTSFYLLQKIRFRPWPSVGWSARITRRQYYNIIIVNYCERHAHTHWVVRSITYHRRLG